MYEDLPKVEGCNNKLAPTDVFFLSNVPVMPSKFRPVREQKEAWLILEILDIRGLVGY